MPVPRNYSHTLLCIKNIVFRLSPQLPPLGGNRGATGQGQSMRKKPILCALWSRLPPILLLLIINSNKIGGNRVWHSRNTVFLHMDCLIWLPPRLPPEGPRPSGCLISLTRIHLIPPQNPPQNPSLNRPQTRPHNPPRIHPDCTRESTQESIHDSRPDPPQNPYQIPPPDSKSEFNQNPPKNPPQIPPRTHPPNPPQNSTQNPPPPNLGDRRNEARSFEVTSLDNLWNLPHSLQTVPKTHANVATHRSEHTQHEVQTLE